MWLINVRTLKLEEVWDKTVKEYAILSHRWEEDEVSFKDMQNLEWIRNKPKFTKIRDSSVCYAFLSDVYANAKRTDSMEQQIGQCIWFERGWTLQELLAPSHVVFYNNQWEYLGTKETLSDLLVQRTGIHREALNGGSPSRYSIAQRMSWASRRTTTRPEDIAYCLLGIFDVNMPMLYGEGTKAFMRLQEELIKRSDDHTIFAWPIQRDDQTGLLADSPAAFAECQDTKQIIDRRNHSSFSITNRGLPCRFIAKPFIVDTYLARLDCKDKTPPYHLGSPLLGIYLRRPNEDDQNARVRHNGRTLHYLNPSEWERGNPRQSQPAARWYIYDERQDPSQISVNVRSGKPDPQSNVHVAPYHYGLER
ncbi:MAG: hypothetical protein Q9188_003713 [Gyalolechia gomerana]